MSAETPIMQVDSIDRVEVSLRPEPHIQVTATGSVSTTGWTNPRLALRNPNRPPHDGIYEFDFVAEPPTGLAGDVVTQIHAVGYVMNPYRNMRAVRVIAKGNRLERPITSHAPAPIGTEGVDGALPLAHVSRVVATQHRHTLYLSVTGRVSGFDGTLEIVRSPVLVYPPLFRVFELPGNCGITGECPPDHEVTVAKAFSGTYPRIQVVTADGTLHPHVTYVRDPETVTDAGVGLTDGAAAAGGSPSLALAPEGLEHEGTGWWAWENLMPGSLRSLHVLGRVMMPASGYKLALTKAQPQGINPRILILDLTKTPPGATERDPAPTEASFEEPHAPLYSHVVIRGLNPPVTIPVKVAW